MNSPLPRRPWWRETHLWALLALVAAIYFSRVTQLTIRGEESRRARVACEMLETGDWIVPREQGRVFADRPPLANWTIAASMWTLGSYGALAVRLPTILATLLTTLLVYGYSRTFLSAAGALAAGAAYATFGQILQLGFLAETEATLTLLVGASLLVWHWGYSRRWPTGAVWVCGYALAGLAALTKGPQGPVYFLATTWLYLALRKDWRFLFSPWQLAGLTSAAALVAAWQIPLMRSVSVEDALKIWGHHATARFDYSQVGMVARHLFEFPLEILGCLLPWSIWLAVFLRRRGRQAQPSASDNLLFLSLAIGVAFPTCWLAPQARGRYFMPLYPCFAPLVGLAIERAMLAACTDGLRQFWRRFQIGVAATALAAAAGVGLATCLGRSVSPLAQPVGFAIVYGVACLLICALAWQARDVAASDWRAPGAILATTAFLGLTYSGVFTNVLIGVSEDTASRVAALKKTIPPGEQLVSLGWAHHSFMYHYGQPVPRLDLPDVEGATGTEEGTVHTSATDRSTAEDFTWFCFHRMRGQKMLELPFDWEPVAEISCDRNHHVEPKEKMVVGRRVSSTAQRDQPPIKTGHAPATR